MIKIMCAVDKYGGFGKDGKIPWHFPEDFKHFKETTAGHVCIMGRKTYDEIYEHAVKRNPKIAAYDEVYNEGKALDVLPGRKSIVVTSSVVTPVGVSAAKTSLAEAIEFAKAEFPDRDIFIIGGQRLFEEGLELTDVVHLTVVKREYDCDRFFPTSVLQKNWKIVAGKEFDDFYFVDYHRLGSTT